MTGSERHPTTITTVGEGQILIERIFDASPDVLWRYYTEPELLAQWLGPRRLTMALIELDVRPGGAYRFVQRDAEGNEYSFFGEYRVVVPPRLLEWTFNFEGAPGTSVDRNEFTPLDGDRTRVLVTSSFDSGQARDGMLSSGMETGVREGNERLDELLANR